MLLRGQIIAHTGLLMSPQHAQVLCLQAAVPPLTSCRWLPLTSGPGVGKGRQVAAVILENFLRGRTKVRRQNKPYRYVGGGGAICCQSTGNATPCSLTVTQSSGYRQRSPCVYSLPWLL